MPGDINGMLFRRAAFLALVCLVIHAPVRADSPRTRDVTIRRDTFGVPHISGKTDADAAFGLMYAQAEDNFWQLETDYARTLGRAAELEGPSALAGDLVVHAWQAVEHAQEHYRTADPKLRALCDAFAAGVNRYLATHPQVKPRLLTHFEPWFILATEHRGPAGRGITRADRERAFPVLTQFPATSDPALAAEIRFPGDLPADAELSGEGSNMWAISGSRTTTGRPMLLINPHVGFFGGGQRYEAHLSSREGLDVSGFAILGTPYIRSGHNRHLAWSHTNNYAFTSDTYQESADATHSATAWSDTVKVLTSTGLQALPVTFRRTHHGPVLGLRLQADGATQALTVRAIESEGGSMAQRWAMARAGNLTDFKQALGQVALTGSNTIYADAAGNIFYLHGNGIPKRNPNLDWSGLVDGSNPETEWLGRHKLEDLPQVLNPASGWLQNCNSTPFLTTDGPENPRRESYPAYMAPEPDTPRSRRSRDILAGTHKFSFEEFTKLALDTKVGLAKDRIPELLAQFATLQTADPSRAALLAPLVNDLTAWDQIATIESTSTTLFMSLEMEAVKLRRPGSATDPYLLLTALEKASNSLQQTWGTPKVAWGEINRLQRIHTSGTDQPPSDARPSLAVPGIPSFAGGIFTFGADPVPGQKRWYGVRGDTYTSVVNFAAGKIEAKSLLVFGQSADPASPHHLDQARLYAAGRFKSAWFEMKQIKRHTERSYRP